MSVGILVLLYLWERKHPKQLATVPATETTPSEPEKKTDFTEETSQNDVEEMSDFTEESPNHDDEIMNFTEESAPPSMVISDFSEEIPDSSDGGTES